MNKIWTYLKSKDFLKNSLGAVGTVVAVVLIVFFSLSYYTHHGDGIPVPVLVGKPVEQAISTLEDQGFQYKIDSVYIMDKTPGTVTVQDPDAGTSVKPGRMIYLTIVTRRAPNVSLPDLTDKTYLEAAALLGNDGLKVGDTIYRADIARDHVLQATFGGQVLKPGDKLPKGSRVDLVLGDGQGASEVDIPQLVNLDLDEARFALKNSGLTMGEVTYQGPITDSANLVIVSQTPARTDSTSKTSIGTRVNLVVTQGTKTNEPQP